MSGLDIVIIVLAAVSAVLIGRLVNFLVFKPRRLLALCDEEIRRSAESSRETTMRLAMTQDMHQRLRDSSRRAIAALSRDDQYTAECLLRAALEDDEEVMMQIEQI